MIYMLFINVLRLPVLGVVGSPQIAIIYAGRKDTGEVWPFKRTGFGTEKLLRVRPIFHNCSTEVQAENWDHVDLTWREGSPELWGS